MSRRKSVRRKSVRRKNVRRKNVPVPILALSCHQTTFVRTIHFITGGKGFKLKIITK